MPRAENNPIVWREKKDTTYCDASYKTNYAHGFNGPYRRVTHFCGLKRNHEGPHFCFCNGYELTWYEYQPSRDVVKKVEGC
jgi:hypothetical protein